MAYNEKQEYLAPNFELIQVNVERGFADSFGSDGQAGGDFGNGNRWDL